MSVGIFCDAVKSQPSYLMFKLAWLLEDVAVGKYHNDKFIRLVLDNGYRMSCINCTASR